MQGLDVGDSADGQVAGDVATALDHIVGIRKRLEFDDRVVRNIEKSSPRIQLV